MPERRVVSRIRGTGEWDRTTWSSENGKGKHVGNVICCVIASCDCLQNGSRLCFFSCRLVFFSLSFALLC